MPLVPRLAYFDARTFRTTGGHLIWTGPTINRYGYMCDRKPPTRAHRWSYETFVGPIPAGMFVLHRCDITTCVAPAHLFLGTQADNMHDMAAKGRSRIGEHNPHAKLTEHQVLEMRALRRRGWKLTMLADRYGIDFAAVSGICRRKSWTHI